MNHDTRLIATYSDRFEEFLSEYPVKAAVRARVIPQWNSTIRFIDPGELIEKARKLEKHSRHPHPQIWLMHELKTRRSDTP